ATVLAVDKNQKRLRLRAGSMEIELPFSAVSAPSVESPGKRACKSSGAQSVTDAENELNLIGFRVDEAIGALDKFLDNCTLIGTREVRIIHGKGTGSLMRGVREYLSGSPQVETFRKGEGFEGGDGVTVVTPSPPSKPSPLRKVSTCGDPERYSLTPRISEPVPFPWIMRTSLVPISVQLSRNLSNAPIASSTLNPIRLSSFSASVTLCAPELL